MAEMRHVIANLFRVFDRDSWSPVPWPWVYGDAMNIPPAETPRQNVTLTATQLAMLQQWSAGDFDADYVPGRTPPRRIEDVPLAEQPDMLDRAALEFCLADAFHPGCEMTWPMRTAGLYMAPFRLLHAPRRLDRAGLWPGAGADLINLPNGPLLGGQLPGGITRWMAVPWQTDTASCRSGYLKSYDPYLPTFWPARVPNQILTQADYEIVLDPEQPLADRLAAFARRASWLRPLGSNSYTDQINNMIAHFDHMGVVESRRGPTSGPFPRMLEVEDLHPAAHALAAAARSTRGGRTRPVGHRQGTPLSARPAAPTRLIRADVLILVAARGRHRGSQFGADAAGGAGREAENCRRQGLERRCRQRRRRLLTDMGLIDEFFAQGHVPCYGNRSIWGRDSSGGD